MNYLLYSTTMLALEGIFNDYSVLRCISCFLRPLDSCYHVETALVENRNPIRALLVCVLGQQIKD